MRAAGGLRPRGWVRLVAEALVGGRLAWVLPLVVGVRPLGLVGRFDRVAEPMMRARVMGAVARVLARRLREAAHGLAVGCSVGLLALGVPLRLVRVVGAAVGVWPWHPTLRPA